MSPTSSHNGSSRTFRASQGLGGKTGNAAHRSYPQIGFYERCDLHVGYRVHAHIHFLSRRNPSILLHEDGRGRGVDEALGLPGIPAWSRTLRGRVVGRLSEALTGGEAKPPGAVVADKEAPDRLRAVLEGELRSRWARFAGLPAVIDAHYDVMTRFLRSLPGAA